MQDLDLNKLQNKWVAFTKDRKKVVEYSTSLEKLLVKISNQKDLIISFVQPPRYISP
jgi:hypothetical protein